MSYVFISAFVLVILVALIALIVCRIAGKHSSKPETMPMAELQMEAFWEASNGRLNNRYSQEILRREKSA